MLRRRFVMSMLAAAATPRIMTVRGPVDPARLGAALPHEHLFSNFGADAAEQSRYDEEKLLAAVVPYVESVKRLGCRAIFDATAAWFGRHPRLLRTVSERTGVHVITNTGIYGAANDRYVPAYVRTESADTLAWRWAKEWKEGIDGTGIRPGFIKLGVDASPLSDVDKKLVAAGARAHRLTGLTVAVHTGGDTNAAFEQIAVLKDNAVHPSAWIWVHANGVKDPKALVEAARQGAWISLDGLEPSSVERHFELWSILREQRLLGRVLLSHDGNSFRCCGRPPKPYDSLYRDFLPRISADEARLVTVRNPAEAYSVRLRSIA